MRILGDHVGGMMPSGVGRADALLSEKVRPGRYAGLDQCRWELRQANELYRSHDIPVIDSSAKSVEEMATLVLQTLKRNGGVPSRERIYARDAQGGTTP